MYRIGLKKPHDSFFDKETRLYLHYYAPFGYVKKITKAIEAGLKSGRLVDLTEREKEAETNEVVEKEVKEEVKETVHLEEEQKEFDIENATKEEILAYMKDKNLTLKDLGLPKNATLQKIKEALLVYEA